MNRDATQLHVRKLGFVTSFAIALGVAACKAGDAEGVADGASTDGDAASTDSDPSTPIPGTLGHPRDPVALDGAQVRKLVGAVSDRIAAYAWDGSAFRRIAVQIDPREVRPFSDALSTGDPRRRDTSGWSTSFYTDSNRAPGSGVTFVGADRDTTFDADDELVFMAGAAGLAAPDGANPPGVDNATRVAVHVLDAKDATRGGYVYLYVATAASAPRPDAVALDAKFPGRTGSFTTFFDSATSAAGGAPPRGCGDAKGWGVVFAEDTTIRGASYERHFSGRWLDDVLRVSNGRELGPDLLDIHESRPVWPAFAGAPAATTATVDTSANRTCTRSVTSFSGAAGTIVTLRSGPVRAIRSYFGSNSGTLNQRTHLFYADREDIYTFIRVHPIPGITDGFDLSEAARGMRYFSDRNLGGLAIDGTPDTFDRGYATWEMVAGATQNTVLSVHRAPRIELGAASASYAPEIFFIDDASKLTCVCSGDGVMLGAHGVEVRAGTPLPNTDPRLPAPGIITLERVIYGLPGLTEPSTATKLAADAFSLRVSIDGQSAFDPNAATCGDKVCEQDETSVNCASDCPPPPGADVCGDGTCGGYEPFVCLADCKVGHQPWFECASASCSSDYVPCVGDPDCKGALASFSACSSDYATCAAGARDALTDPLAKALFQSLTAGCGSTMCASKF